MNPIRHVIVALSLLGASLSPHAAHAAATASPSVESPALEARTGGSHGRAPRSSAPLSSGLLALGSAENAPGAPVSASEDDTRLAQREQASPELRDFRGGRVYLYLGGGATLLLVLLLVLILL